MTSAIVAMIPFLSPCFVIGLPIGIWPVIVLNKPEVRSAFSSTVYNQAIGRQEVRPSRSPKKRHAPYPSNPLAPGTRESRTLTVLRHVTRHLIPSFLALGFAVAHTVVMQNVPVGHSDIIPPTMIWLIVDFPVSLLVALALDPQTNAPLLLAGGIQWALWGFLIGTGLQEIVGQLTLPRISLRGMLGATSLLACALGLYVGLWDTYPEVPFVFVVAIATGGGVLVQVRYGGKQQFGAISGGAVGGVLAWTIHVVCAFTMPPPHFESGLTFIGTVVTLGPPFVILIGAVMGSAGWAVASFVFRLVTRIGRRRAP